MNFLFDLDRYINSQIDTYNAQIDRQIKRAGGYIVKKGKKERKIEREKCHKFIKNTNPIFLKFDFIKNL